MDEERRNNFLAQEYLQLQKTVEDFDARALTIKAWSVTFSAAGLGLAYQQHIPLLLLIAAASACVFWIVEAVWKIHQRAFYSRIEEIEGHFLKGAGGDLSPFQIRRSWNDSFRGPHKGVRWIAVPFYGGVMLPHLLVVAAGITLWFCHPPSTANAAGAAITPPPPVAPR